MIGIRFSPIITHYQLQAAELKVNLEIQSKCKKSSAVAGAHHDKRSLVQTPLHPLPVHEGRFFFNERVKADGRHHVGANVIIVSPGAARRDELLRRR